MIEVKQLPLLVSSQILEEIKHNPKFALHIEPLLKNYEAVYLDMNKALINEFTPSRYPETLGWWSILRSMARKRVKTEAGLGGLSGWLDDLLKENLPKLIEAGGKIIAAKKASITRAPVAPAPVTRVIYQQVSTTAVAEQEKATKDLSGIPLPLLIAMGGVPIFIILALIAFKR